ATCTSMTAVLNPVSATVTLYVPATRAGTLNTPSAFETVSKDAPDVLVTVTAAPGMAPPAESTTVPEIDAVAPCAETGALHPRASVVSTHTHARLRLITDSLQSCKHPKTCEPYRRDTSLVNSKNQKNSL